MALSDLQIASKRLSTIELLQPQTVLSESTDNVCN